MEVKITQELLDEINVLINSGDFVDFLNNKGASVEAMLIIMQTIMKTVDFFQDQIDAAENEEQT